MDSYEKKYKEIVGKIRKAYLCAITDSTKAVLEEILPELKESEDEKIRKWIINEIKIKHHNLDEDNIDFVNKAITWLEKQGEQKPNDKVKSKFKIGDWIIENGVNRNPVQITSFEKAKGDGIKVWFNNGTGTFIDFLEGYHKWTIQDAKDGDVLVSENFIFIFKNIDNGNGVHYYCHYEVSKHEDDNQFDIALPQSLMGRVGNSISHYSPATKEQRDILMKAMADAGYTFDFEKKELKELKKIEENSADKVEPKFKVGDWVVYECGEDSVILQIKNIVYDTYEFTDDSTLNVADENTLRLWTIQDAKEGDVLATDDGNICVFDGTVEDGKYPFAYYGLTRCRFESYDRRLPFTHDNVHPATKEQHDLLFAKMKEAGYEWNTEKKELKELKKVESKPVADFSDIRTWKYIVDAVLTKEYGIGNYLNSARTETIAKELQERFGKIEQKLAWSALDERNLQGIIDEIKANKNQAPQYDLETYDRFISWLNSLKDRFTYKASNK